MSHVRDAAPSRNRKANCRKGSHAFGRAQEVGAGIVRRVCQSCAAVSIDLTRAEPALEPAAARRMWPRSGGRP